MRQAFKSFISDVEQQYERLLSCHPFPCASLPRQLAKTKGIYLFSENEVPLYVGRTNDLRRRLQNHTRRSHNTATFAFLLARQATGRQRTYQPVGSRADLLKNDAAFAAAFDAALMRVKKMNVQVVREDDPIKQALLEIYAAFVSGAKHNDFDNH
jgi:predicted GIY-YIG superfamily endonuclease